MSSQIHPDMLSAIFALQSQLNDFIFEKQALKDNDGKPLRMTTLIDSIQRGELGANDLPNQWLMRYAKAIKEELRELTDELRWKWWSKDKINLQNIRVEL